MKLKVIFRTISILYLIVFAYLTVKHFHLISFGELSVQLLQKPLFLMLMVLLYGCSFCLRALSWMIYLQQRVSFWNCLYGLWYSLLINHVLPIKAGDIIRIGYIRDKGKNVNLEEITHSVVVMRLLDMITLIVLSAIGIVYFTKSLILHIPKVTIVIGMLVVFSVLLAIVWKHDIIKRQLRLLHQGMNNHFSIIMLLSIVLSWLLESAVVYFIALLSIQPLSIFEAIWINSVTIGGQIFQLLPGGIATYETTMAFALTNLNFSWEEAYSIAVLSHIFKFLFSYAVGLFVIIKSPIKLRSLAMWLQKKEVETK